MSEINSSNFLYHIFPLGACGAPENNDFSSPPQPRLRRIHGWLDHIQALGADTLFLGPVFESGSHGYDTANYYEVDRRLGTREDLAALGRDLRGRGMRLVLDGVFNHTGRDFWAFRDLRAHGPASAYQDWYSGVRFDQRSPMGDSFSYDAWNGHFSLPKLNLENPAVREHLFGAVRLWVDEFGIDGIRLDAADALSFDFMRALRAFSGQIKPDLWLMGEVIHGDYRQWANAETLHSTTNYELYKGLHSAHNEHNYFELAYSLNRQFGAQGIYQHLQLNSFADNHDVTRIASQLREPAGLYPLHAVLFCAPGIPSIYYGSEFGIHGVKTRNDWNLRPEFNPHALAEDSPQPDLFGWIRRLAEIRKNSPALRWGGYAQRLVAADQFGFSRHAKGEDMLVLLNNANDLAEVSVPMPGFEGANFRDLLTPGEELRADARGGLFARLYPKSARILRRD